LHWAGLSSRRCKAECPVVGYGYWKTKYRSFGNITRMSNSKLGRAEPRLESPTRLHWAGLSSRRCKAECPVVDTAAEKPNAGVSITSPGESLGTQWQHGQSRATIRVAHPFALGGLVQLQVQNQVPLRATSPGTPMATRAKQSHDQSRPPVCTGRTRPIAGAKPGATASDVTWNSNGNMGKAEPRSESPTRLHWVGLSNHRCVTWP